MTSIIAAGIFAAGTASASTVTFDFTNSGYTGWQSSFVVTPVESDDLIVDVSAASYNDQNEVAFDNSRAAIWQYHGLGVCGMSDDCHYDGHQVDSVYSNDMAIFDFGRTVVLESIEFGYVNDTVEHVATFEWICNEVLDGGDCADGGLQLVQSTEESTYTEFFDLFIENGFGLNFDDTYQIGDTGNDTHESFVFSGSQFGTMFGIGASGNHDAFKIRNITVSDYIAPVPLPASALMLLAGLAGLGAMRRKKS